MHSWWKKQVSEFPSTNHVFGSWVLWVMSYTGHLCSFFLSCYQGSKFSWGEGDLPLSCRTIPASSAHFMKSTCRFWPRTKTTTASDCSRVNLKAECWPQKQIGLIMETSNRTLSFKNFEIEPMRKRLVPYECFPSEVLSDNGIVSLWSITSRPLLWQKKKKRPLC